MRRRGRRVSRLELFYCMVLTCLMVGGSLWLDRNGVPVTGRVAGKQERIVVGHEPSGDWRRYYEVTAAFALPEGGDSKATVRVHQERYDSLRAGHPIELRYLPQFPLLARTTDRSTASVVSELAWGLAGIPIVVWVVGGFLALWIAARMGTIPVLAAGVAWLVAGYSLLLIPPSREGPRPAQATARCGASRWSTSRPRTFAAGAGPAGSTGASKSPTRWSSCWCRFGAVGTRCSRWTRWIRAVWPH